MLEGAFRERERALEDAFFYRVDQELTMKLRQSMVDEVMRDALSETTGSCNRHLLQGLVDQGFTPESLVALSLVPLVMVAWADEGVDPDERKKVAQAAEGIETGSACAKLFETWLSERPSQTLFDTWKEYLRSVVGDFDAKAFHELKQATLDRCKSVAKATGGSLGYGRVSPSEEHMLRDIEQAFSK